MVTKKDFKAIAKIIKLSSFDLVKRYSIYHAGFQNDVVDNLADYFKTQNPRFDYDRFIKACCE